MTPRRCWSPAATAGSASPSRSASPSDGHKVAVTHRGRARPRACSASSRDVTDTESVDAAFKEVEAEHGPVEVLVANAGITDDTLLMRMTEEQFTASSTPTSPAPSASPSGPTGACCGAVRPDDLPRPVVGLTGGPGRSNYAASKAGLVGMARSIARELGSRGITANVVAPGFIDTDMTAELNDKRREEILGVDPAGAHGQPRGRRRGPSPSSPPTTPPTSPAR